MDEEVKPTQYSGFIIRGIIDDRPSRVWAILIAMSVVAVTVGVVTIMIHDRMQSFGKAAQRVHSWAYFQYRSDDAMTQLLSHSALGKGIHKHCLTNLPCQTSAKSFRKPCKNAVRLPTGRPFGLPETPGGHIRPFTCLVGSRGIRSASFCKEWPTAS